MTARAIMPGVTTGRATDMTGGTGTSRATVSSKGRGGLSRGRRTVRTTTDRHNYHDPVSSTPPTLPLMAEPSSKAVTSSLADIRFGSFDGEVGFLREGYIPPARV